MQGSTDLLLDWVRWGSLRQVMLKDVSRHGTYVNGSLVLRKATGRIHPVDVQHPAPFFGFCLVGSLGISNVLFSARVTGQLGHFITPRGLPTCGKVYQPRPPIQAITSTVDGQDPASLQQLWRKTWEQQHTHTQIHQLMRSGLSSKAILADGDILGLGNPSHSRAQRCEDRDCTQWWSSQVIVVG